MTHAQTTATLILAMSFAFLLGWFSRGDVIYGKMFNSMTYLADNMVKK